MLRGAPKLAPRSPRPPKLAPRPRGNNDNTNNNTNTNMLNNNTNSNTNNIVQVAVTRWASALGPRSPLSQSPRALQ